MRARTTPKKRVTTAATAVTRSAQGITDQETVADDGKVGTATTADVEFAATLPPTAGPIERKPISGATLNLLKEPTLLAALEANADQVSKWKGCGDVPGILAMIHRGVQLSVAHPRLAVSYARARQARIESNRELEALATVLAAAAALVDGKSALGRVLAPFAARRGQARGTRKASATRHKKARAKGA